MLGPVRCHASPVGVTMVSLRAEHAQWSKTSGAFIRVYSLLYCRGICLVLSLYSRSGISSLHFYNVEFYNHRNEVLKLRSGYPHQTCFMLITDNKTTNQAYKSDLFLVHWGKPLICIRITSPEQQLIVNHTSRNHTVGLTSDLCERIC